MERNKIPLLKRVSLGAIILLVHLLPLQSLNILIPTPLLLFAGGVNEQPTNILVTKFFDAFTMDFTSYKRPTVTEALYWDINP